MELQGIQGGARAQVRAALQGVAGDDAGAALRAAEAGRDEEAAHAFEEIFARIFVRELRRGLPEGVFGGGAGSDVYEGWFDEHLGAALVQRDALGLAGVVKSGIGRVVAASEDRARQGGPADAPEGRPR